MDAYKNLSQPDLDIEINFSRGINARQAQYVVRKFKSHTSRNADYDGHWYSG